MWVFLDSFEGKLENAVWEEVGAKRTATKKAGLVRAQLTKAKVFQDKGLKNVGPSTCSGLSHSTSHCRCINKIAKWVHKR